MWHIYIIKCADNTLYTGTTTNISRRIKEHNHKKGGSYTRIRLPVMLLYSEAYLDRSKALRREAQIKQWTKKKKLALIAHDRAQLIKLSKSRD